MGQTILTVIGAAIMAPLVTTIFIPNKLGAILTERGWRVAVFAAFLLSVGIITIALNVQWNCDITTNQTCSVSWKG